MYRTDPLTGDLRLVAPGRAARLVTDAVHGCPFCGGNEESTPPETGRVAEHAATAAHDAWGARSFPNRFPLTRPHEVLVPTPRHVTTWRDLTLPELQDAVTLLLERRRALLAPNRYVHVFVNDGEDAGASIAHAHAQLVVLDASASTDRLTHGVRRSSAHGCQLCRLLEGSTPDAAALLVERGRRYALLAHPVPRLAGGIILTPLDHETQPGAHALAEFAALLHRALQAAADGDLNLWLIADETHDAHWYAEIQPRTANLAGVELAVGLHVSAGDAATTASELRERLALSVQP